MASEAMFETFFRQAYCSSSLERFVYRVVVSQDSKIAASGSADHTIRLWELGSGRLVRTLNGHTNTVWSVLVHPNQETCASASGDRTIRIWQLIQPLTPPRILTGHTNSVNAIALTSDGQTLISGSSDTTIKCWGYHTGALLRTLTGHKAAIFSIAVSPDSEILASSDRAGFVKLWNLATGELLQTIANQGCALFSPDGQFLITSHQGNLKLWQRQSTPSSPTLKIIVDGDWWIVLGVDRHADPQVVKCAYRDLARQYHPDINRSENAPESMQILNKAFESFQRSQSPA
jgi:WD40 repeat protein